MYGLPGANPVRPPCPPNQRDRAVGGNLDRQYGCEPNGSETGTQGALRGCGMTDGFLPGALTKLRDAVSQLIDPRPEIVDGKKFYTPSLYRQLTDDIAGQQGQTHSPPRSLPLIWCEAFDCLHEIDTTISAWQPAGADTPGRLHLIETRWVTTGRPQDVNSINQITGCVNAWVGSIKKLLFENHTKTLSAPCPRCHETTAYHRDSTGEVVRGPSLQLTKDGCTCMNCRTTWDPEHFEHLARVIGCDLPNGVLE